MRFDKIDY